MSVSNKIDYFGLNRIETRLFELYSIDYFVSILNRFLFQFSIFLAYCKLMRNREIAEEEAERFFAHSSIFLISIFSFLLWFEKKKMIQMFQNTEFVWQNKLDSNAKIFYGFGICIHNRNVNEIYIVGSIHWVISLFLCKYE